METPSPISVLCVDDESGMAELIATYLERFDDRIEAATATGAAEAIEALGRSEIDCIVSDYDMPGADGLVLLESVRAEHPELPFVLFTGRGSEEIASEAISAGVTDYMQKGAGTDQYRVLARRIENAVSRHRLRREAETAKVRAETILEASPDAILVASDGRCVYANPAAVELFGADGEGEVVGADPRARFRDDAGADYDPLDGGPVEHERCRAVADRREIPVEVTARRIVWGSADEGEDAAVYIVRDVSERLDRERELDRRQSILDSTFEASPDGIVVTTDEWEILTYNDRFLEIWGLSESALETDDGELAFDAALDAVADPAAFESMMEARFEVPDRPHRGRIELADGTRIEQYSAPIDPDAAAGGYVWFYRELTPADEQEAAEREALDRIADPVCGFDDGWRLTFCNDPAAELFGLEGDPGGTSLWTLLPESVDTELYERLLSATERDEPATFDLAYPPLNTTLEVRIFPADTGVTAVFHDIATDRRTDGDLRAAVDVLHELYEVTSDRSLGLEAKQDRALEIGRSYLDVPYAFVTEITDTEQRIVAAAGDHDLLQPGEVCPLEESYCRKTVATEEGLLAVRNAAEEGWTHDPAYDTFELETYIGGRVLVDGDLYGTVCFASGTSRNREFSEMEWTFVELLTRWLSYELEHRLHTEELREKNAQLDSFASVVSHDLRNPLNVASGRLELLAADCDSEHLPAIERAHDRMGSLIEDVLTLAREGEVIDELDEVDLAALCETCWGHVATRDATLSIEADRPVVADRNRLTQLLENLVRNSIEHGGSDVTVRVGDLEDGFYVEDDGAGIPDAERAELFADDTVDQGIGLRIVKRIAEPHGWEIRATESDAGGARFEFTGVRRALGV